MIRPAILYAFPAAPGSRTPVEPPRAAVLLHGLGRTARAMHPLAHDLSRLGFDVLAVDYPSRSADVDTLTSLVFRGVFPHPAIAGAAWVAAVTHSLGGILLRAQLERAPWPALRRAVMFGPPNDGSEAADLLSGWRIGRRMLGPALMDMRTAPGSRVHLLPAWPAHVPLKIIAGTRSLDPWFSACFRGSHDGKVAADRTRLAGAAEYAEIPVAHPFLMTHPRARRMAAEFLAAESNPLAAHPGTDSMSP